MSKIEYRLDISGTSGYLLRRARKKAVKCKHPDRPAKAKGLCIQCYRRDYYEKHRQKEIDNFRQWANAHRKQYLEYKKQWNLAHPNQPTRNK